MSNIRNPKYVCACVPFTAINRQLSHPTFAVLTHSLTRTHRFALGTVLNPTAVSSQIGNKLSQAKRRARPFAARRAPSSCINCCYQDPGVRRGEHGFEAIRSVGREFCLRPSAGQQGGATGASGGAARDQGDTVQTSIQQSPIRCTTTSTCSTTYRVLRTRYKEPCYRSDGVASAFAEIGGIECALVCPCTGLVQTSDICGRNRWLLATKISCLYSIWQVRAKRATLLPFFARDILVPWGPRPS